MHGGGAELGCKGVKLVDVPIGVVARQRERHQGCGALSRNAHAGMRKRQQQRRIALRHGEPRLGSCIPSFDAGEVKVGRGGERAGAHEIGGRCDVGREVAVVVELRHALRAAASAPLRAAALDAERRMEVAALRGGEQLDRRRRSRRSPPCRRAGARACAAIDTWSSWLAEVGIESTLAG